MKTTAKKPTKKSSVKVRKFETYTDVKTFEDACAVLKLDPKKLPIVKHLPKDLQRTTIDGYKLKVVIKAINKIMKWAPDYTNGDQQKWYAWFWVKADKKRPSGFAFAATTTNYVNTTTNVGPRLTVGSREEIQYIAKQFENLYIGMHF